MSQRGTPATSQKRPKVLPTRPVRRVDMVDYIKSMQDDGCGSGLVDDPAPCLTYCLSRMRKKL